MEPVNESESHIPEWEQMLATFQECVTEGKREKAEGLAIEMLARAAEWAEENPSADQDFREQAESCEENGDWPGAEAARKQVLQLALQNTHPGFATKAHWELGIHFTARNLIETALIETAAAVECARASDIPTLIQMSLQRHATTLLLHGDFEPAFRAIDEALTLLPNEALTIHSRAKALTIRARCAAHLSQLPQAELDLHAAAGLIQPIDSRLPFSGSKSHMAFWWQASSVVCAERKDWTGALKAAREELALRRFAVSMPHLNSTTSRIALAETLSRLAQYNAASASFEEAQTAIEESKEIRRAMNLDP